MFVYGYVCVCIYMRRLTEKEHKGEENFSPAELQKNQITSTVDGVVLKEDPPIVITSEARGYKYSLRTNEQALCPLQSRYNLIFLYYLQSPCNIPSGNNSIA